MFKIKELSLKHPDKVPLCMIVENKAISIPKNKFLAPKDYSFSEFVIKFRTFIKLEKDQGLFYLIKQGDKYTAPRMSDTLSTIYNTYVSEDGMLYVAVTVESMFGN
jgi:hypothetical protein